MRNGVGAMTKSSICRDRVGTSGCCQRRGRMYSMKHSAIRVSLAQSEEKNTIRCSVSIPVIICGEMDGHDSYYGGPERQKEGKPPINVYKVISIYIQDLQQLSGPEAKERKMKIQVNNRMIFVFFGWKYNC